MTNERWTIGPRDHLRHGEGFARAGDAEKHLVALLRFDPLDEFVDRARLIALGLEFGDNTKSLAALRLVRTRRPMRRPGFFFPDVGIAALQQIF